MIQEITEFDKTVHRNQRHTGPRILQYKTARVTLTHDSAARRIGAGIWLPRNCSGLGDRRRFGALSCLVENVSSYVPRGIPPLFHLPVDTSVTSE